MPIASGSHAALSASTSRGKILVARAIRRWRAREHEHASLVEHIAATVIALEGVLDRGRERLLQQARFDPGVRRDERQHGAIIGSIIPEPLRCRRPGTPLAADDLRDVSLGNGSVVMMPRAASAAALVDKAVAASAMPRDLWPSRA